MVHVIEDDDNTLQDCHHKLWLITHIGIVSVLLAPWRFVLETIPTIWETTPTMWETIPTKCIVYIVMIVLSILWSVHIGASDWLLHAVCQIKRFLYILLEKSMIDYPRRNCLCSPGALEVCVGNHSHHMGNDSHHVGNHSHQMYCVYCHDCPVYLVVCSYWGVWMYWEHE